MAIASPRRVLLVSESSDEREMYAASLQRSGFCTLQAANAADGYRLASELDPSAIVTDVRLDGGEDGLDLTRRLKQDERTRRVPVVVLTGYVFPHDRDVAARAGCDRFVPKPCLPDSLSKVVSDLVDRRS